MINKNMGDSSNSSIKPVIAIYRTSYRAASEVFIKEQVLSLNRYQPIVWARDVSTIARNEKDEINFFNLISKSILEKILFTLFGILPKKTWDQLKRPDLIHAHFGPDGAVVMPLAVKLGIPLIVTCHGFDVNQSKWAQLRSGKITNILFLLREKKMYFMADRIIVVSDYLKKRLIARGCPENKIFQHYIGVDLSKFSSLSVVKNQVYLVNIARHINLKAVDVLLRSLAIVIKKWPQIKLLQIGEGEETDNLKELSEQLGISKNIEWLGFVEHNNIIDILNKADIYVHPGRIDKSGHTEAFGLAIIEAQISGVPVVATNCGGISEALQDGVTGYLCQEDDYIEMAKYICELLEDKCKYEKFSKAAIDNVVSKFDISKQTKYLEEVYDNALREK